MKSYSLVLVIITALILISLTIPASYSSIIYTLEYHVNVKVTKNTIPSQTITLADYIVQYRINLGDKVATVCYNITGLNQSFKNTELCKTINMSQLLKAFNTGQGVDLSLPTIRYNNMSVLYSYKYIQDSTYNGIPVYVLEARVYTPFYCGVTNKISKIYVYRGLPIPLYASIYYVMCDKYQIHVEAKNTVLPKDTIGAHINSQHYTIVIGGLRGAQIALNGDKNTNQLKAVNKGDKPGYVMILCQDNSRLLIRILPPGKSLTIELPVALEQNIHVEAGTGQNIDNSSYTMIYIAIISAVGIAVAYLVPKKFMAKK